jgi:alpha-amylase
MVTNKKYQLIIKRGEQMKRITTIFSFMLSLMLVLTTQVNAAEFDSVWENCYFRGTPNSWQTNEMELVADNTWQITVSFNGEEPTARFKFDRYADWSHNVPSQDIHVEDFETYVITFYDDTYTWDVEKKTGPDITPPEITINGSNPVEVELNSEYNDAGATAIDNVDGDITSKMFVENLVDTSNLGRYTVTYTVTDKAGNSASEIRTVNVVEEKEFVSVWDNCYFRGTPNGWKATSMELIADNTWSITIAFYGEETPARFKFDRYGDWTYNRPQADINVTDNKTYVIKFFDDSETWEVKEKIGPDDIAPVITINGDNPATVIKDSTYDDSGATALDNVDGDITDKIFVENLVNTSTVGKYTVTYTVTDKAGNSASEIREVNVVEKSQFLTNWGECYFRGTPNGWQASSMNLVADYVWEIEVEFGKGDAGGSPRFKIDRRGDWTENYPTGDETVEANSKYTITFNENTKDITKKKHGGAINGTIFQYFEWYVNGEALHPDEFNDSPDAWSHWNNLRDDAKHLEDLGVTAVWLPPVHKTQNEFWWDGVGYAGYDLWDLGEFNQKGRIRTRYGTKAQLQEAIAELKKKEIQVYADIVFNHLIGGDFEPVEAYSVNKDDRTDISQTLVNIMAQSVYNYEARNNMYSDFKWNWTHFDAVKNNGGDESTLYIFKGKSWDDPIDDEKGNYDYLLGSDLDFDNTDVKNHLKEYGVWLTNELNLDGYRIDAMKHIKWDWQKEWLDHVKASTDKKLFAFGEHLGGLEDTKELLGKNNWELSAFDFPLFFNLRKASTYNGTFDLRTIFNGTLTEASPVHAVQLVNNHDFQTGRGYGGTVMHWFKEQAYSLILLRNEGYPVVFYADMYGSTNGKTDPVEGLEKIMVARKEFAYGEQRDYFTDPDCIGWVRMGNDEHPKSIAVVITDRTANSKWMQAKANTTYKEYLGNHSGTVYTDGNGWGEFPVADGSTSIWLEQ